VLAAATVAKTTITTTPTPTTRVKKHYDNNI
jgi:hypothetical protein